MHFCESALDNSIMATNTTESRTLVLLPADAQPPKSKSAAYYAVHPLWQDVSPIPQADQSGTLAAIAYSPRYSEAMSYLRALMADNEISDRALALTQDLISMNPAHYTVWIYRMRVLKGLWSVSKGEAEKDATSQAEDDHQSDQADTTVDGVDKHLWGNVQAELKWLDEVSFRNLKNYQIWHHRHALADLLPSDTAATTASSNDTISLLDSFIKSEQRFLAQILSLDTKNYHVWSYRQWLCSRFPSFLLPANSPPLNTSIAATYRSHPEVAAIDLMIDDDIRNNSAWSHRYFLLFGHHELTYAQAQAPPVILKLVNEEKLLHKAGLVDNGLVEAEINFTKDEIRKAPQNGSTWNYLGGVLRHGNVEKSTLEEFCEEFLGPNGDLWMDQWVEVEVEDSETGSKTKRKQQLGVRSSHAVEWLSEIYHKSNDQDRALECLRALSEKWDIIRKGYWEYKLETMRSS